MIAQYLSADPGRMAAVLAKRTSNLAKVYTTLRVLERCIEACEVLAEELGSEDLEDPLHGHINECIAACEQLTGACMRQSRFTLQYAELCAAACANLAGACEVAPARTALQCGHRCVDCIAIMRDDFARTISN